MAPTEGGIVVLQEVHLQWLRQEGDTATHAVVSIYYDSHLVRSWHVQPNTRSRTTMPVMPPAKVVAITVDRPEEEALVEAARRKLRKHQPFDPVAEIVAVVSFEKT